MELTDADFRKIKKAIEYKKMSVEELIKIIDDSPNIDLDFLFSTPEMVLTVDYTQTVAQAISSGNYGTIDENATVENFPIPSEKKGKIEKVIAVAMRFNQHVKYDDAVKVMSEAGYRPANLMELLALGASFPELSIDSPIMAIGAEWFFKNLYHRPFIAKDGPRRWLSVEAFINNVFYSHYRCLAIRD